MAISALDELPVDGIMDRDMLAGASAALAIRLSVSAYTETFSPTDTIIAEKTAILNDNRLAINNLLAKLIFLLKNLVRLLPELHSSLLFTTPFYKPLLENPQKSLLLTIISREYKQMQAGAWFRL